ncbi:glycosyltransferase family 4 protein [Haloimpatiens lingqiaonensis]|uniref:glycosyltransferase family 4 protein n=1 Tax=Haloimpatiens lingqiaonensis TaxID=1380675 RepID=UPI0010FE8EB6|nr:glycosyltransferase family 4 protein [Haloimpatiens lingqiaonensis]
MINKSVVFLRSNPVNPDPRVEKEANSLIKEGYNVIVVAWDRSEKYKMKEANLDLENGSAKIYRFGIPATYGGGMKSNLKALILFQIRLIQWLFRYRKQYDIIHACDFDTAFVASKCSKILNKKLIYDIFDYYVDAFTVPKRLKKIIESLDQRVINSADGVIICTEKRKEQIKGTNPKRLAIIHNSPAFSNLGKHYFELNQEKIKIAYVGVLLEGRLLKELANVIINNTNLELHIGGFGKLERYFEELSLKYKNVIYYGKLEYSKTIELENSCDIMTAIYDPRIPNHYYAAPNKFYEALMLGKPVIMVKNTGMDEVVSQNSIGEVIDYNSESLEAGINNLISRKSSWKDICQNMKQLYKGNYSWDEMEKRLISLYKSIGNMQKK